MTIIFSRISLHVWLACRLTAGLVGLSQSAGGPGGGYGDRPPPYPANTSSETTQHPAVTRWIIVRRRAAVAAVEPRKIRGPAAAT